MAADTIDVTWPAIVQRLSPSSRRALTIADAFRKQRNRDAVHMEHLLVGLYEKNDGPTMQVFQQAGVFPDQLRKRLLEAEVDAPQTVETISGTTKTHLIAIDALGVPRDLPPFTDLPPLSKHVEQAIVAAAILPATNPPQGRIQSRHLLNAAFSIEHCTVIRLFASVKPAVVALLSNDSTDESQTSLYSQSIDESRASAGPQAEATSSAPDSAVTPAPTTSADTTPGTGVGSGAANDRAEGQDQLHFTHYVQAFTDLIESPETQPPLVIGIFGSWGAGKSFLLTSLIKSLAQRREILKVPLFRQIGRDLAQRFGESTPPDRRPAYVYTVSFNAWEYNAAAKIWPRLVRRVLDTVNSEVRWKTRPVRWTQKTWRKLRRNFFRKLRTEWPSLLGWLVVSGALAWVAIGVLPSNFEQTLNRVFSIDVKDAKFSIVAGIGAIVATVKLLAESFLAPFGGWVTAVLSNEAGYGGEDDAMRAIREDLDLLDGQLAAENSRVVIVVDDLDRCEPEKAIELLQAINLMLDRNSFIVALGIDARVITAAVEKHYKDLLGPAGITGYEYLDKIVQIPFRIPEPTSGDVADFLAKQLREPAPPTKGSTPTLNQQGSGTPSVEAEATLPSTTATPAERGDSMTRLIQAGTVVAGRMPEPTRTTVEAVIETARGLLDAPPTPLPPLAFSYGELQAFQRIAGYLRPNPRHIKRLVNVYALVRALAVRLNERRILESPSMTVLWLALCAQWPYATREMLLRHDVIERDRTSAATPGQTAPDPPTPPLKHLLNLVAPQLDVVHRRRFDHDDASLDQLVAAGDGMTWDQLRTLRRFTLNFNPALDSELRALDRRKRRRPAVGAQVDSSRDSKT